MWIPPDIKAMTEEQMRIELIRLDYLDFAYAHCDAKNNGEAIAWLRANQELVDAHFAKHPMNVPPSVRKRLQ